MTTDGRVGWEQIVDSCLDGKFDVQELNDVAALAYKCVNRAPTKRPSMKDIVQVLSRILKLKHNRKHDSHSLRAVSDMLTVGMDQTGHRNPLSDHRWVIYVDSTAE
ncbi:Calcium/calmodulin-regulated receptor-like kinase 1 [Sarracenia purpurea var. burkii]